jgi:membrane-anchored glycerophosphoryl diester phosphodiesterase (GDPDase)
MYIEKNKTKNKTRYYKHTFSKVLFFHIKEEAQDEEAQDEERQRYKKPPKKTRKTYYTKQCINFLHDIYI